MDWTMSNLAGATGIKSPTLLQSMIAQALEPDNRTKLTIDEKGGMQMKVASDGEIVEKAAPSASGKPKTQPERAKGPGYFGTLDRPGGGVSTELSIGVNIDGRDVEIPSLVPTLTQSEIDYLLGGNKPTRGIVDKAVEYARRRLTEGKSPFAESSESRPRASQIPQSAMAEFLAPYAGPSASELAGLTPEQVMAVVNAQRAAEGIGRQTLGEIAGMPLEQAQIDLIREKIRAAQAPPEQWENVTDKHGRWFKRNTATNEVRQVAGPPPTEPLTFDERMTLKKTAADIPRGDYWKSPETGDIKWIESGKVPPAKWERVPASQVREVRPTIYERKLPTYAYDMLVSYIKDKEGKLLKKPDIAGIASLNEELKGEGKEVVEVEIEPLEKKWAFDLPGQTIHVIVDVGATSVTRSQVEDMLVSVYGLSPEDAKKVKVK